MENNIGNVDLVELDSKIDDLSKSNSKLKQDNNDIASSKMIADQISQVVWEQFIIQIGETAGQDFIKDNHDLNLNLRKADHCLSEEDFNRRNLPSHNFDNQNKYQERYDTFESNFASGTNHEKLNPNYRKAYDANRAMGSKTMAKDHTIPLTEIVRDKKAGAFMDQSEKANFANDTEYNLKDLPADANESKGDRPMREWLESTRDGLHPYERFNIDKDELLKRDDKARKEYAKRVNEAEQRAIDEGKKSIGKEALRSAKYSSEAIVVALLAKLTKQLFQEFYRWFKEKECKIESLINHIKKAILDFLTDFKSNIELTADVAITSIATQIFGAIVPLIRKAFAFFKIGGRSIKNIFDYLGDAKNQSKDYSTKCLEIGKIVIAGLTSASALALSAIITAGLMTIPGFAISIPIIGSPASILGIFFSGFAAGVCGAIVLNTLNKRLGQLQIDKNNAEIIRNNNAVLKLQNDQYNIISCNVNQAKAEMVSNIENDFIQYDEEIKRIKERSNSSSKKEDKDISNLFDSIDKIEW